MLQPYIESANALSDVYLAIDSTFVVEFLSNL